MKEVEKGQIHTGPVLITCWCRNVKERLEVIVRKAGFVASFQWPKECMEFVDKIVRRGDNGLWKKGVLYKNYTGMGRRESFTESGD
jgi:hypothetical protein